MSSFERPRALASSFDNSTREEERKSIDEDTLPKGKISMRAVSTLQ